VRTSLFFISLSRLACGFLLVACSNSSRPSIDGGPTRDGAADATPKREHDAAADAGPKREHDGATDAAPEPTQDGGICASHHAGQTADGDPVEICDHLFATRPWVNPPPDDTSDAQNVTLYGTVSVFGIDTSNPPFEPTFYDRTGTAYVVVDASGQPLLPMAHYPAGFEMPSDRNLYLIYKASGKLGTATRDGGPPVPTLQVTTAAPAILLDGVAIDSQGLGVWEGTVSARNPDGGLGNEYDPAQLVPIRVSFTSTSSLPNFEVWGGDPINNPPGPSLKDGTRVSLQGTVENLDQPVLAADGTCLPSLSNLGPKNPFFAATAATVQLARYAGMHGASDRVSVFTYPPHDIAAADLSLNGMAISGLGFFDPVAFLLPAAAANVPGSLWNELGPFHHHALFNGHVVTLHQVSGGGGSCMAGVGSGIESDAGAASDDGGVLGCVGACGVVYCTPCVVACLGATSVCGDGG
jgi:hypothetical protein